MRTFRDSTETLNEVTRMFNQIISETYDLPRANLEATSSVPMQPGVNASALTYTFKIFSEMGMAKIVEDGATDIPAIGRSFKLITAQLYTIADSYSYTTQELDAWSFMGENLSRDESDTARRKIDEKVDEVIFYGSEDYNLTGMVNHPNVPIVAAAATGTGSSTAWNKKTLAQITTDIQAMIDTGIANTAGTNGKATIKMETIKIPHDAWVFLTTTFRSDAVSETYLDSLKKIFAAQGITTWEECIYLDDQNETKDDDRAMLYKKDKSILSYILPVPFRQLNPQYVALSAIVNCFARCGGTVFKRPTGAVYLDF